MDRLPREERMKGYRDVYWEQNERPFDQFDNAVPVCVEIVPNASSLVDFQHPNRAVYVFGPEDGSVPQVFRRLCQRFIFIPSAHCLNLSAAVNVVLYDRRAKRIQAGLDSPLLSDNLREQRGTIDVGGWDGK
jgi:tRNA(Leu) C34 or U34 (ribose-2'-O)-methylase TrmL